MVVQAYILIQTEVGKAADVAREIAEIEGVTHGRGRHRARTTSSSGPRHATSTSSASWSSPGPGRRRHHPHADLPGRPPLTAVALARDAPRRLRSRRGRRRAARRDCPEANGPVQSSSKRCPTWSRRRGSSRHRARRGTVAALGRPAGHAALRRGYAPGIPARRPAARRRRRGLVSSRRRGRRILHHYGSPAICRGRRARTNTHPKPWSLADLAAAVTSAIPPS